MLEAGTYSEATQWITINQKTETITSMTEEIGEETDCKKKEAPVATADEMGGSWALKISRDYDCCCVYVSTMFLQIYP